MGSSTFTKNAKNTFCQISAPNTLCSGTSTLLDDKRAIKAPATLEPPHPRPPGQEWQHLGEIVCPAALFAREGPVPDLEHLRQFPGPLRHRAAARMLGPDGSCPRQSGAAWSSLAPAHPVDLLGDGRSPSPGRKRHCPRPALHSRIHISLLFADVDQNNGTPLQDTAVTDSKRTAGPKNAWPDASPADPGGRPHLIRLFSRDAPGREDNTFKDRPSESDELQTIQEDSAAAPEGLDVMAAQKRPSQRSKYLASASTMDHARHGFLPRHRDTGILDSLGRFFGADRGAPKRGSGKVSSEE